MMTRRRFSIVAVAALTLLSACSKGWDSSGGSGGGDAAPIKGKIRFLGSASTGILTSALGDEFVKLHPDVKIEVEDSNSNWGVGAAKEGTTDIGMSIRDLTADEQKVLDEVKIGRDGLAIIVHKENPITAITDEQFKDVVTGKLPSWKDLGGADTKIERVNHAEVRTTLQLLIKYLGIQQGDIKYSDSVGNNDKDIIKSVSSVKEAISYASIGAALNAIDKGTPIKMIGFKGIDPTVENVENSTVPITYDLKLVTRKTSDATKKAFMTFAGEGHPEVNKKAHYAPKK